MVIPVLFVSIAIADTTTVSILLTFSWYTPTRNVVELMCGHSWRDKSKCLVTSERAPRTDERKAFPPSLY